MSHNESRTNSPSGTGGSVTISGSVIVACVLCVGMLIATAVAFMALGRVAVAEERARLSERETRVMQDDLKFVRAWLSARGYEIPINHEEAEEKASVAPDHHRQRR